MPSRVRLSVALRIAAGRHMLGETAGQILHCRLLDSTDGAYGDRAVWKQRTECSRFGELLLKFSAIAKLVGMAFVTLAIDESAQRD